MTCWDGVKCVIGETWWFWNEHQTVLVFLKIFFLSEKLVIFKLYDFNEIFEQAIVVCVESNAGCQLLSGLCIVTCACAESVHTFDVLKF